MDESGPPCRRCAERGLSCTLNKSLQTLIEERSQWKTTVSGDLEHIHSALQELLNRLSLPLLPPLQTTSQDPPAFSLEEELAPRDDPGPSCDASPRVSPKDDELSHVPIESLYQITRLRALRSDDPTDNPQAPTSNGNREVINDFISNGQLGVQDSERLVQLYLNRLDHFMYMIGGVCRDLESLHSRSQTLTACICTVAALHDPNSNHLYASCNREFRRLMAASMFDRRIDRDHLRAMCIGSYWLSDISWTLSGYAIRRATEANLNANYHRVISENNEDAADCLRLWYILYICDHHLSILYGRPSIIREDFAIVGWEAFLKAPISTESDKRLISQVALIVILSNVRELFGPDTGEPIPRGFGTQLAVFNRQINQWMGTRSSELQRQHHVIGEFPAKGVILHHHFAKLHLHSHVFRGLKDAPVPPHFLENASAAVSAATSIVESLLMDSDLREGLVGIPHYLHTMTAFACVFLLKVVAQYPGQFIEDLQFRSTAVGKWHLVHLMADGLEKLAAKKITSPGGYRNLLTPTATTPAGMAYMNGSTHLQMNEYAAEPLFGQTLGNTFADNDAQLGSTPFLHFENGQFDFNYPGFGLL
ncbi:uncharacterized protein LY89DRAFT_697978 [Mollisia scopiformis]|uniref:Xylanolytic transcriptional activator regulatory domain-containing protein n=1 Tax=Mollisia scopiformis TaxID=149040 RepID=A0A194X7D7_MOLSC|nr:uncharacterized protein LY89DRAFT_697978 [Mollisia scopiformis]KUJ16004.1 hypothetical protein LY89DRAFT_697978 [Mollisia scopiformis]